MFVIKRAEALMMDVDVKEITQDKMAFFRQKMAVELYHWADNKTKTGYTSDTEIEI